MALKPANTSNTVIDFAYNTTCVYKASKSKVKETGSASVHKIATAVHATAQNVSHKKSEAKEGFKAGIKAAKKFLSQEKRERAENPHETQRKPEKKSLKERAVNRTVAKGINVAMDFITEERLEAAGEAFGKKIFTPTAPSTFVNSAGAFLRGFYRVGSQNLFSESTHNTITRYASTTFAYLSTATSFVLDNLTDVCGIALSGV
ncbi:hypothetical protein [Simkania negevensis]|uniref:Uncharacterized protein n=1 Tax=Simkania negevensis (strain ATCC VR-1471 / DSM 27360 / Z) TaxID=331113 RepID=F8L333_SIMNZ|nr:hypothetical protein [Simkania negevensis]CCB89671.1 unknown protein [Simkania negevensis Z]